MIFSSVSSSNCVFNCVATISFPTVGSRRLWSHACAAEARPDLSAPTSFFLRSCQRAIENRFLVITHQPTWFGDAPEMATADRGFFSAQNEREAEALGVEKVALPATGRLSKTRARRQKERWFKRALRWRAGCEATISHLKNPFSMRRARYKGERGFKRYVGWCVITKNLFSIARWQERRKKEVGVENVQRG